MHTATLDRQMDAGGPRTPTRRRPIALAARYAMTLFRLALGKPLFWVSTLVAAVLFMVGVATMAGMPIVGPYDEQVMQMNMDLYDQQAQDPSRQAWLAREPASAAERLAQEEFVDRGRVYEMMRAADDDEARIEAILALLRHEERYPSTGFSRTENEAEQAFYQHLSALDEPHLYQSASEMPPFELITYRWQEWFSLPVISPLMAMLAANPANTSSSSARFSAEAHLIMLVPAVMASVAVFRWKGRRRLLDTVPLARGVAAVVEVVVAAVCSLLAMAVVMLPSLFVAAIKNGVGNPSYPVAYFHAGDAVLTTAGDVLVHRALLCVLAVLVLAFVLELSCCATRRVMPGLLVAVAIVLVPLIPDYFSRLSPVADMAPWLVSTYLCFDKVVGGWGYFINIENDVLPLAGCTFERGVAVLCGAVALLMTFIALALAARHAGRLRRMGRRAPRSPGSAGGSTSGTGCEDERVFENAAARGAGGAHFAHQAPVQNGRLRRAELAHGKAAPRASAAPLRAASASYCRVMLRGYVIPVAIACEAVLLILPAIVPFRTGMEPYTQDAYAARYREHSLSQESDHAVFNDPDLAQRDIELLAAVARAPDARSFVEAAATYEAWWSERMEEGVVSSAAQESVEVVRGRAEFYRRLAAMDDPAIALAGSELPFLQLVAFEARVYPVVLLALPSAVAGVLALAATRRGALRQAPVRAGVRTLSVLVPTVAVGLGGIALAWAPALALALARCGWGAAGYPVVVWGSVLGDGLLPGLMLPVGASGASLPTVSSAGAVACSYVAVAVIANVAVSVVLSVAAALCSRVVLPARAAARAVSGLE